MSSMREKQRGETAEDDRRGDWGGKESRIINKCLVYAIGLPQDIASEEELKRPEYFGQYGTIVKVIINTTRPFNAKRSGCYTYSAYVTFSNEREASLAILAIEDVELSNSRVQTSYGTTKYCNSYQKKKSCQLRECLYLHSEAAKSDILSIHTNNNQERFKYLRQIVSEHLAKQAREVLAGKYLEVVNPVLPPVSVALDRLREYCRMHKIPIEPKTSIVVRIEPPKKWEQSLPILEEEGMRKNTSVSSAGTEKLEESTKAESDDQQSPLGEGTGLSLEDRLILDRLLESLRAARDARPPDESVVQNIQSLVEVYLRAREGEEGSSCTEADLSCCAKVAPPSPCPRSCPPYGLFRPGGYIAVHPRLQSLRNKLFSGV